MSWVSEDEIKRSNLVELWGDNYPEVMRWLGRALEDFLCYEEAKNL
jgi:hypothetical protein